MSVLKATLTPLRSRRWRAEAFEAISPYAITAAAWGALTVILTPPALLILVPLCG